MNPADRIKELYQQASLHIDPNVDQRMLDSLYQHLNQTIPSHAVTRLYGKLAAAIVLVTISLLATTLQWSPNPGTGEPQSTGKQTEFALAEELFANQDQEGLLALLETGNEETCIAVAGYLGQIGDESVWPTLARHAALWQGPGENPYQTAIQMIDIRLTSQRLGRKIYIDPYNPVIRALKPEEALKPSDNNTTE